MDSNDANASWYRFVFGGGSQEELFPGVKAHSMESSTAWDVGSVLSMMPQPFGGDTVLSDDDMLDTGPMPPTSSPGPLGQPPLSATPLAGLPASREPPKMMFRAPTRFAGPGVPNRIPYVGKSSGCRSIRRAKGSKRQRVAGRREKRDMWALSSDEKAGSINEDDDIEEI
jgi:hypothetical protein